MTANFDEVSAYEAMLTFLEKYYRLTEADGVAELLGSMQLSEDGKPADPAIWQDWIDAVRSVRKQARLAS